MVKAAFVTLRNCLLMFLFIGIFILGLTGTVHADSTNLALAGTATQSSIYDTAYADKAIDNNTDGNFFSGSVTHTLEDVGAWWKVDLGETYNIDKIVVWNRTDFGCGSRLDDFYVSILDAAGATVWISEHNYTFPLDKIFDSLSEQGQFVKVGLHGTNYLHLAEVQVLGSPVPVPAAVWLLGSGLLGLIGIRRKISK